MAPKQKAKEARPKAPSAMPGISSEGQALREGTAQTNERTFAALGVETAGVASSVLFARILSIAIAGVSFVVVSRLLGPSKYGMYVLAVSVAGLLAALGGLGIATSFSKFVAEYKAQGKRDEIKRTLSSGYFVTLLFGIVLALVCAALSGFISQVVFGTASYTKLVILAAILVITTLTYNLAYYSLVGFGRKKAIVTVAFVQIATQAVISIALAFAGFGAYAPLLGLIAGLIAGTAATILYIYIAEKISLGVPDGESIGKLLRFSLPLGIFGAASGAVFSLSSLILGAFSSFNVVGNVGVSQRVGNIITLATDSVGLSLLPLFASAQHVGLTSDQVGKLYDYAIYLMFVLFAPPIFYMALLAKPLSYLVFGAAWQTAPYFLVIVSIGLLIMMTSDYTTSLLIARDKVNKVMKFGTAAAVAELALLLLLTPMFRGFGMVFTVSIFLPITTLVLYHRSAVRELGARIEGGRILRVLAATLVSMLAAVPILLFIPGGSLTGDLTVVILAAAEQLVLYPIVLALLKGIERKDTTIIRTVSNGVPVIGAVLVLFSGYAEAVMDIAAH